MIAELVIGALAGILSGLFGIGGAVISTPLLRLVLEVPGHIALGTPLPLVIPATLSALLVYGKKKALLTRPAVTIGIVASFSTIIGARATSYFSGPMMMFFTSIFILVVALKLAFPLKIPKTNSFDNRLLIPIGILVGLVSGFLGIGGGAILVPLLLILGVEMHAAVGTSLLAISIFSIPGSLQHYYLGNVSVPLLIPLAIGVIVGAQFGSRAALKIKSESLEKIFVAFLLLLAFWLMFFELLNMQVLTL